MEGQYSSMSSIKPRGQTSRRNEVSTYNREDQTFKMQREFNEFLIENEAVEILQNPRQIRGKETYININLEKISREPLRGVTVGFIRSYLIEKDIIPTKIYGTDNVSRKLAEDLETVLKPKIDSVQTSLERPLILDGVTYSGESIIRSIGSIEQEVLEDSKQITALGIVNTFRQSPTRGEDSDQSVRRFTEMFGVVTGTDYKSPGLVHEVLKQANIDFSFMTSTPQLVSQYSREFDIPSQAKDGIKREFSRSGIKDVDWE